MSAFAQIHRHIGALFGRSVRLLIVLLLLVGSVVSASVISATTAAAADTVVPVLPNAMGFTSAVDPYKNFNTAPDLAVSKTTLRSYLSFNVPTVSVGASIVAATVTLRTQTDAATVPAMKLEYVPATFSAATLTHANRPKGNGKIVSKPFGLKPSSATTTTVDLMDVSGITPGSPVAFAVSHDAAYQTVYLSKTVTPVLRITVRPAPINTTPQTATSTQLPYVTPPPGSSAKKVFAHYFTPYPVSLDNKAPASDYYTTNYLNPDGENGKFKSVGGLLRDRPAGRAPIAGDFLLADAKSDVRAASAAGIDGFTVNVLGYTGTNWARTMLMEQAAHEVGNGFVVVPMLDQTATGAAASVDTVVAKLAEFYAQPGAYRLSDGRYVLSSFKAEGKSIGWWKSVMSGLQTKHNVKVAFVGMFLHLSDSDIAAYAPISYGLSVWGVRNTYGIINGPEQAAQAHAAGTKWMAPIAVQDVRHNSLLYAESGNTETLRASWARAMSDKSEMVQMITWNDYSESTSFAPSAAHGHAWLDLNGYYIAQFKKGSAPTLIGDEVIVDHRTQSHLTVPTVQTTKMDWTLSGTAVKPRDTAEVVVILALRSDVTFKVGSRTTTYDAPAGVSAWTVPLAPGDVSASVSRNGKVVRSVVSPYRVLSTVTRWDLQYHAASSRGF